MKMPTLIENIMLAPCGVNCMVCYRHCYSKKPCTGCLVSDLGKTAHCLQCKIKVCVQEKGLEYCFQCDDFPCKSIKNMDKSYKMRYGTSIIRNGLVAKAEGIDNFMISEKGQWTCPHCGGVISLQHSVCSECQVGPH